MRSDRFKQRPGSENLAKTLYTAMIIGGIVTFVAMFFPLREAQPPEVDLVSYYLPWSLPYGIVALAISVYALISLTSLKNNVFFLNFAGIAGIIAGSLIMICSFPIVFAFQAWEFFISLLAIGICVLVIGILEVLALKNKE